MADLNLPTDINWGTNEASVAYIKEQFAGLEESLKKSIQQVLIIGRAFQAVQKKCQNDEFMVWIDNSFADIKLKKSSVYRYIHIYEHAEIVDGASSIRQAETMIKAYLVAKKAHPDEPSKTGSKPDVNSLKAETEKELGEVIAEIKKLASSLSVKNTENIDRIAELCDEAGCLEWDIMSLDDDDLTDEKLLKSMKKDILEELKAEQDEGKKKALTEKKRAINKMLADLKE